MTKSEIDILINLIQTQITGINKDEIEAEIPNGYFGIKSYDQAIKLETKLWKMRNK